MDHQRQNNRRDSSPSIDLLNGLGESNSIYGILASELFALRKYDLSCKVKVGEFKRDGGFSDVYDGILELDGGGPTLLLDSPGVRRIKVAVKRLRFLVGMHDEIKKVKIAKVRVLYQRNAFIKNAIISIDRCEGTKDMGTSQT